MNDRDKEIYHALYLALQSIMACPRRECKCCHQHEVKAIQALSDFLNRWRDTQ